MKEIYQLRISLKDTDPEIYRTIQIEKHFDFYILHLIIQGLMNWTNNYYYEFSSMNLKILEDNIPEYNSFAYSDEITIQDVLVHTNDSINYLYDEQDIWEMKITLEKILPKVKNSQYPVCIDGEYNGPLEDCGGIEVFNEYLEGFKHPELKEKNEFDEFFGKDYDPEKFDIEEKNKFLYILSSQYYNKTDSTLPLEIPDQSEFEGYNFDEMEHIVTKEFTDEWPIILKSLNNESIQQIPIMNQMIFIMEQLQEKGEIKLTTRGNLPRQMVLDIYSEGFLKEKHIEQEIFKLSKEEDSLTIHLSHVLLDIMRYVKKRKNKLSLTKAGKAALKNKSQMAHDIFLSYCNKFNWGYFDSFENELIGRFGFGFTIILMAKYGEQFHDLSFYSDKYFMAFPTINYTNKETLHINNDLSYFLRSFERFLYLFGLVEIDESTEDKKIRKTDLFDAFFAIVPPSDLISHPLGMS